MATRSGFESAQQMRKKHPHTFWCPSETDLDGIEVGGHIKVATDNDMGERFWVKVTHVEGEFITGTVDNDLVRTKYHGWKYEDELKVHRHNVYDILPA